MGMDRDFPITAAQAKVLIVGLLVLGGFGAALFGGFIPGLKPNYSAPNILVLDGERYYFTTYFLSTPLYPTNFTAPESVSFHNVSFAFWVSNWFGPTGGLVHGNGTETNGTVYSFVLGMTSNPPVNTTLFLSPDRWFAVYWSGGILAGSWVHLMVHV
jgi:hypothetical protein